MVTMIIFVILITIFTRINAKWRLEWSDEFNESSDIIDVRKWRPSSLPENCQDDDFRYSNAPYKLPMIDGCLALKGLPHGKLPEQIMTQSIIAKRDFTLGRIEIKASFPLEEGLWPIIMLINKGEIREGSVRNISFMYSEQGIINTKNIFIESDVQFENDQRIMVKQLLEQKKSTKNQKFQLFTIEWNTFEVILRIDSNITFHKINSDIIAEEDPFELSMAIGVGGQFQGFDLDVRDVNKLVCPTLLIDYVRYYKHSDELGRRKLLEDEQVEIKSRENIDKQVAQMCAKVRTWKSEKLSNFHKVFMILFISLWIILLSLFQFKLLLSK